MSNRPTVSALLHTEFPKLMRTTALTRSLFSIQYAAMQRNQVNVNDQIARVKKNFANVAGLRLKSDAKRNS